MLPLKLSKGWGEAPPALKDWAHHFELKETPDSMGYFGYKEYYGAYCEVISYSKLVADAQKRNQAFFHKLGLPSRIQQ